MNATLIRMTCAADGTLLQPSRPAASIDAALMYDAFGNSSGGPKPTKHNNPAVWATHTQVGHTKYGHVLVIGLNKTWSLLPEHVPLDIDGGAHPADYVSACVCGCGWGVLRGEFENSVPL
jgi:hypothetical protein